MIYNLLIQIYQFVVRVAALFYSKPAKMVQGHREVFEQLKQMRDPNGHYLWFHAASLGEFEQGRPLMENIRRKYPTYKIVLTFFSPSGYEVRKNYEGADIICYLPFDTASNARRFVELLRPSMAFFIKYEFWGDYLTELKKQGVPIYSISSIFRPNQLFFKWYGKSYSKVLHLFTHLFVQDDKSKELLKTRGVTSTTVIGDTRFDRVLDICAEAKELPLVEAFQKGSFTLVVGSSWEPDEAILLRYFNEHPNLKLVIAPHVVSESHITHILSQLKRPALRYSQATAENISQADSLIIDGYGLLSSIYRYGKVAYVGGGFGVGIHNVLEAAVYSIPVLFGPNHKKFREAGALLETGGAFEIGEYAHFEERMDCFMEDMACLQQSGEAAGRYVADNSGAVNKVIAELDSLLSKGI
ncbi:MAG: 3-deoxy-D-manno-octulosonic acid transferase [Phocaeicola sp.]